MDARFTRQHHAPVRAICDCGACREIEPEALARLVGWKVTLKELALRMRCSRCVFRVLNTRQQCMDGRYVRRRTD